MTTSAPLADRLSNIGLLAVLDDQSRAELANRMEVIRPKRGKLVLQHMDESDDLYFVLKGKLTAILISAKGREVALGEILPGRYFGELAAINGGARSASIYARSDAEIARLPGSIFRAALEAHPQLTRYLLKDMTDRVRILTQRSFELTALRLSDRLCLYLVRLALEADVLTVGGVLRPAPTHAEIAAQVGANREAVSRELSSMVQVGMIETQRGRITFLDPDAIINATEALTDD